MYHGGTVQREIKNRFFKSLTNLNITIKNIKLSLSFKPYKKLVNNIYHPPFVNEIKQVKVNDPILSRLSTTILKLRRNLTK